MKIPQVRILVAVSLLSFLSLATAQPIYQLTPLPDFGSHGDGSLRTGDTSWLDNGSNQRGLAFDSVLTNLVLVDTHTGAGASPDPKGAIYILDALTGANRPDGFSGNLTLNTNGIPQVLPNQAYPYAPVAVADDGAVYVCNQVNDSSTTPFIIYRYESSMTTNPPSIAFSNAILPRQRYGTSIDIRGAGANTQIIIGSLASSSTGTNVVIFTTANGLDFTTNVLGANVTSPNFNDGVAFGAGNTFWAKQIGQPLRVFSFDLAGHSATVFKTFDATTFPDGPNLTAIAVSTNLGLLAALEETGGGVSGGPDKVRLYDISNFSNQPPALLDVRNYTPDNQNTTAPMGYLDFVGTNLYAQVMNNGLMGFGVGLGTPPGPVLTAFPAETNQTIVGQTVSLTVAGFPSVSFQWQSNNINILNATNGTLTLVNVQSNFAAIYKCVVSNGGGSTNASTRVVVLNAADFYHLNLQWTAYPGDGLDSSTHAYINNGDGASPGTPNLRSIAYNPLSNHVYAITRSGFAANPIRSNYNFNVVDASTGTLLYTMKTNGITLGIGNGGIGLASVGVAEDGGIYACNIAPVAAGWFGLPATFDDTRLFRIYRWADGNSNTPPVQIFSGDPAVASGMAGPTTTNRWGDSLAVRGSGTNTLLILDNNNANARYVVIFRPSDTTMTNWTAFGLHQVATGTTIGRSLNFGSGGTTTAGTFWQKRNATAVIQSQFDLENPIDPVPAFNSSTAFTNALSGATIDASRKLLFGVATYANATITPDTLNMYEVSSLTSPLLLAQYNFPVNFGTNHNGNAANAINQTIISGNKLFTLNAGNGLMAFQIAAGPPSPPVFLVQPQDTRVILGGSVALSATVDQQATFQWRVNNVNIPGATSASYTLSNAQLTNAGLYRVVASNIFGISTSAVANVTIVLPQDEYSLLPVWSAAQGTQPYLNGSGGGTPNQRTIAYNAFSNHLYVVSRSSTTTSNFMIWAVNASDGTVVSALNTNGIYNGGAVGEGGIGLVGIGVSDDGSIYACNSTPDGCGCGPNGTPDSFFRIYRWADGNSNTLPVQVFEGDPGGQTSPVRWGDMLRVRGSGINTEILVDSTGGNGAVLRPTDAFLTNFVGAGFTGVGQSTAISRSLQYGGSNTIWQKRLGTPLRLSSYSTNSQTMATLANYSVFPATLGPVEQDFARKILVGVNFKGSASTPDVVDLYDLANPASPLLVAQYNYPVNQQGNGNSFGQVVFAGDRVWALNANNGLVAFTLKGPQLSVVQSGAVQLISWSTNNAGMVLESTPSLSPPVVWSGAGAGTLVGDRLYVTNSATVGNKFYRLKN